MKIETIRIYSEKDPLFERAIDLYRESFPYIEQREVPVLIRNLKDERFHFTLFLTEEKGEFVGFYTFWVLGGENREDQYIYGEHFAIDPPKRCGGIGSTVLSYIKNQGIPVILEIEDPVDDLTLRRKGFYERNGFVLNRHDHLQPAYHCNTDPLPMKIMTFPREFTEAEYCNFQKEQLTIISFAK